MQVELNDYIRKLNLTDDDYLIRSRKGKNQPIKRDRAYKILNEAAREIGLDEDRNAFHAQDVWILALSEI